MKEQIYTVTGTKGMLISEDEKTIQLKYLDPEYELPKISASAGHLPSTMASATKRS